ncbi:MAG: hypothetical protein WC503_02750 [Candidatus Shapirobacteria bacterium]
MIKLKVKDVFDIDPVLTKLIERDLPIKLAFRIGKFVKLLLNEARTIEESRIALFKKYSIKKDGNVVIDPERAEEFKVEFEDLLKEEIILVVDPLPLSILDEIDYLSASPRDMMLLSPLFEKE